MSKSWYTDVYIYIYQLSFESSLEYLSVYLAIKLLTTPIKSTLHPNNLYSVTTFLSLHQMGTLVASKSSPSNRTLNLTKSQSHPSHPPSHDFYHPLYYGIRIWVTVVLSLRVFLQLFDLLTSLLLFIESLSTTIAIQHSDVFNKFYNQNKNDSSLTFCLHKDTVKWCSEGKVHMTWFI